MSLKKNPISFDFGILVICKSDIRTHENIVFNCHTRGNKNKRSNLAIVSNYNAFLYVDKGVNFAVLAYLAFVQVYLVMYYSAFANFGISNEGILWIAIHLVFKTNPNYFLLF